MLSESGSPSDQGALIGDPVARILKKCLNNTIPAGKTYWKQESLWTTARETRAGCGEKRVFRHQAKSLPTDLTVHPVTLPFLWYHLSSHCGQIS
ncbi:uncharacterized [Tachysurus ichikawai]